MADTFRSALGEAAALTQSYIAAVLADQPGTIAQGMIYATQGGKALRAFLVLESARLHGVTTALPAAAAIECMHAYSLVHDDLPCMDDDNLRRGLPTVHVKWDEATAVLVGDALQAMAFECVLQVDAAADARILLAQTLAQASGVRGMVGGQAADIAAETAHIPLSLDEITALQAGKTGALINWSAMSGARLAQADASALQRYGDALGLAFQIWDDVLDVIGDADQVGKAVGKDADAGKATFVSLLGLDGAKRRASDLVQEACDALSIYGDDADTLKEAARFVIARTH
ncbi:polyprenyl synthetase family protein [Yoonia sp. I 8.24]|uniref:polyprenyl synthetase family protein n=1 Tax=Yoonia sp. I 8.24 TaxID=1537229 RepID=UPI001EE13B1D|nr:polyprenyl synthetase family protein [Yoonia sp. I 8.24]MCG3269048.1 polyprenyl synthetase family protein [Yoonia sp. I 8.24]